MVWPYEMDKLLLDKSKLMVSSTWNSDNPDRAVENSVSLSALNERYNFYEETVLVNTSKLPVPCVCASCYN